MGIGAFKKYYWAIGVLLVVQLFLYLFQQDPERVEVYYSRMFYPIFSYFPAMLFTWLPFSIGDIFYLCSLITVIALLFLCLKLLFQRKYSASYRTMLQLLVFGVFLYTYFYISWGTNYYRIPLAQHLHLDVDHISKADHLHVLEKYILIANELREGLDLSSESKKNARMELRHLMCNDDLFTPMLSKTQVHSKAPISSELVSYFTVTGYFNPFTQEVHVNQDIPIQSYPFTAVHELAHQMGIGFEDECNFIAFRKLIDHNNLWYRYSAYYETIQYLLRPLLHDKELYQSYIAKLSPLVKADFLQEKEFWKSYSGWINSVAAVFYSGYLKHNNQPEGLERYNMMAKLVIAWELKNQQTSDF
ncbi:DUF3810 domain-containing protein [Sphingobacterium alkalisoli]|uniref:DUF3810 domain-containing protein n=2 Tax=Sphingobacterium alkalisoli TaxID=1874115 RepID=A0A4U0H216_9SPHI|nr:DUF3810 domain-containing protein [Sphingobacterium alkalisoli]TJY65633.1 DUF3810 domain-containing protein [Sphingobacterium alkalisoli]